MPVAGRWLLVAVLAAGVCFALHLRTRRLAQTRQFLQAETPVDAATQVAAPALPKLVDLGAGTCVPCKMMVPILEELSTEQKGIFEVEFIDVRHNPEAGKTFAINLIPTQIFLDAEKKELFRNEGFLAKEDILAKWREFGVEPRESAEPVEAEPEPDPAEGED
ncbi:MAG: thioredoxin family protein [Lentisphaerae bacterium]|nr:thioredoxin family protein [Lentisphaerota bacterium]MBT4817141.1 thioredoxin family protein [Lentisphaerota bacterium]MBT5611629.1 thioredoxin family protein [Lentisphaerota bacterium]MBT7056600.1 thioredoxin family protein [Lentisphaerota bacterium]MBT7845856.1 thioredoxin family protein [Lentisphaerota bacterium]